MGAAGDVGDGRHGPVREDRRVVGPLAQVVDDLLHRHQRALGGQHRLLLHADDAFQHDVAGAVRLLRVDDGGVEPHGRHGREHLAGVGTGHRLDVGVDAGELRAAVAAEHGERQARRAGLVGVGHGGVAMLLDLQRLRPALLVGVAKAVQRADAGVAAPGEHHLLRRAHADQLIVDEVGHHAHQGQVAAALADGLVAGGVGDQVREALEGRGVAVTQDFCDGIGERQELGHGNCAL
jgi:hypothetical protein